MSKKCFVARIEVEALIVAEDEKEAREVGLDALREEINNLNEYDVDLSIATALPNDWTDNCCVYGTDEDLEAGDALKLNSKYDIDKELEKSLLQSIKGRNLLIKEVNKKFEEAYKKKEK